MSCGPLSTREAKFRARWSRASLLWVATLLAALCVAATLAMADQTSEAVDAGAVHLVKDARTEFDRTDVRANAAWLNTHFSQMTGYAPWFNKNLKWYRHARLYDDAYAIYKGSRLEKEHPEWILTDVKGNRLYIPAGCSNGTCLQWAADISNPAFRAFWIKNLRATLAKGYAGVFIDDVNIAIDTSNGRGEIVAPRDRKTGGVMTNQAWGTYFDLFMKEVRAATPGYEITQNEQPSVGSPATNPLIAAALREANWNDLEFGVDAPWLLGGTGPYSLYAFLAYVDSVHALGTNVDMSGYGSTPQEMQYTLAGYLLISNGHDLLTVPHSEGVGLRLWSGWHVNLGEALGPRVRSSKGLFERRFTGGVVYLNEPGAPATTITLPKPLINAEGRTVTSVTLAAKSAAVLHEAS
jgi:Hypothetical glycosyl hydrolase family 15